MDAVVFSTPQQQRQLQLQGQSKMVKKLQQPLSSIIKTPAAIVRARGLKDITNRTPAAPATTRKFGTIEQQPFIQPSSSAAHTAIKKKLAVPGSALKKTLLVHRDSVDVAAAKVDDDQHDDYEVEYCPPSVDWKIVDKSSFAEELDSVDGRRALWAGYKSKPSYLRDDNIEDEAKIQQIAQDFKSSMFQNADDDHLSIEKFVLDFDAEDEDGSVMFHDITSVDELPLDDTN